MEPRDLDGVMRRLEPTGWLAAARSFRAGLLGAGHGSGRLLVVGTAEDEPWHLTAHLEQAARGTDGGPSPVLVRWRVPDGAPAHLSVGLDELHRSARGATVLVAARVAADERLLDRLDDARSGGATLFALHAGCEPLTSLAHASLTLPDSDGRPSPDQWELATHVIGAPSLRVRRRRLWARK